MKPGAALKGLALLVLAALPITAPARDAEPMTGEDSCPATDSVSLQHGEEVTGASAAGSPPVWMFVDSRGEPIVPTDEQLTAINTLLLHLGGEAAALRPVASRQDFQTAGVAGAGALVAGVDEGGNLAAPSEEQLRWALPVPFARRAAGVTEPIDSHRPEQGFRVSRAGSFTLARIDAQGNLILDCVMPGSGDGQRHAQHEGDCADGHSALPETED